MIIWVDPGLKTGIAAWDPRHPRDLLVTEGDFKFTGMLLNQYGDTYDDDIEIGWERFIITPKTHKLTQAPWSLEVIGLCRWIAIIRGWEILAPANPSDRELGKIEWVDRLRWCPRGMRDDGMSACQHMLAWMLRTGEFPYEMRKILFPDVSYG